MTEMLETQDTNAAEGFDDTGFLQELDPAQGETQEPERDTNAGAPHDPEEGAGEADPGRDTNGAETEEPGGGKPEEKPEEGFLEVTHLGEKKNLTREEAAALAQKGMNYDHLEEQLGEMKAERARLEAELAAPRAEQSVLPLLRAYAKAAGGNMETLTAQMMQAVRQAGIPIEHPKAGTYLQDKAVAEWKAFLKAYPDIRDPRTELPKEVWGAINAGMTPRQALVEYRQKDFEAKMAEKDRELEALRQENETLRKNSANRAKAAGPLSSPGTGKDGFLLGLEGEI